MINEDQTSSLKDQSKTNILDKVIAWSIAGLVFLLPVFFLPLTTDFYEFNKNILLFAGCCLLLVLTAGKMALESKTKFVRAPFDLPIILIAISYLLSTVFASPNRIEALILPGGMGTILALTALYFLITNHLGKKSVNLVINSLIASALVLSLVAVCQFTGLSQNLPLPWLKAKAWSPTGSPLVLATFLSVIIAIVLSRLYTNIKRPVSRTEYLSTEETSTRENGNSILNKTWPLLIISLLLVTGLGLTAYQLLTTEKPVVLPYSSGWVIAVETMKSSPFLGVGPDNFVTAFTVGKPISFNLSKVWNLKFGVSSNFYFHLLATIGLFGLGSWLLLITKALRTRANDELKKNKTLQSCYFALLLSFVLFIFLPANFLALSVTYLLFALTGVYLSTEEVKEESKILPNLIFLVTIAGVGLGLYSAARAYTAELYFKQSLDAAVQNRAVDTYNLQIKAIQTNPFRENYRIAYSQTNFALANAMAAQKDLTDQQRQDISQLVQQAIAEAKSAVTLAQRRAQNWENLAGLYQNLVNFAQGADQWSIAAYSQALNLDPTNPALRLKFGGIYFSMANYDEAIRQFIIAINLKPDFANGHYNLAVAYREKGMIKEAVREMQQVQVLVEYGSTDYQKATQELEDLRAKLPAEEKEATSSQPKGGFETLVPAATSPAGIKPPLKLPPESAPFTSTPSATQSEEKE